MSCQLFQMLFTYQSSMIKGRSRTANHEPACRKTNRSLFGTLDMTGSERNYFRWNDDSCLMADQKKCKYKSGKQN